MFQEPHGADHGDGHSDDAHGDAHSDEEHGDGHGEDHSEDSHGDGHKRRKRAASEGSHVSMINFKLKKIDM